ncbi:MAG: DUF2817 domain-containing protein [Bdellovibrionales bacterium]|nr:DUF2817 domain-containing protein [Bdellovibrionales bacterium]
MKLIFLFVLSFSLLAQAEDTEVLIRIPKSFVGNEVKHFISDHFSHDYYAVGYVSKHDFNQLPSNVQSQVQVLEPLSWAKGLYDIESLSIRAEEKGFDSYHNYVALTALLQKIASENSDIVSLQSAGQSVKGRELWYVILSNTPNDTNKPVTSLIANMHGDETAGRELMLSMIEKVVDSYRAGDARTLNIVNNSRVLIMPSMNPDGFELGRRGNANNVDLNRNFDDPINGASRNPQPETLAVVALHKKYHPNLGLNFHGGSVCFNLPWDHKSNNPITFADDAFIHDIATEYASLNSTMYRNNEFDHGVTYGYEWYQVTGGLQDWSILYADSIHATVELSYTKWPNARDLPSIYNENEEAVFRVLEKGLFGLHLEILTQSGAQATGFEIKTSDSNRWLSDKGSNFIHRLTTDRMQEVQIKANGKILKINVDPSIFDGQYTQIRL